MAAKSKKKTATKKRGKNTSADTKMQSEIIILVTLAISILLLISNFGMGGSIGDSVSAVVFGIFGFMGYLVPILLFIGIAFTISNRGNSKAYIKMVLFCVLLIFLCTFLELTNGYDSGMTYGSYYISGELYRNGGGIIGGTLVHLLCPSIGIVGAYVVTIVLTIICLVCITEKSFLGLLKAGGSRASAAAKRAGEEAKKRRAEQMAQRERESIQKEKNIRSTRREDKKVAGVSFSTTLGGKSPEVKELKPKDLVISRPDPVVTEDPITDTPLPDLFTDMAPENELSEMETELPTGVEEPVIPPIESDAGLAEPAQESAKGTRKSKSSPAETASEVANVEQEIRAKQTQPVRAYRRPPYNVLTKGRRGGGDSDAHLRATAQKLEETFQNFGVNVHVTNASCGPSVTRYEIQPEQGVKVSKIVGLADDIKLNLAVADLRIEAPIPGKAAVGIEVPNKENTAVMLRDLIESSEFKASKSNISFAVGKDISGKTVVTDIAKMPHLLVAGATGSGKSVCINTLIMSILYKASPEDVRLIMIDPKVVELSVYNGIPHLLIPVVTDPKKASGALNWAVAEMSRRYQLFAEYNVRDMHGYNEKVASMPSEEGMPGKMPQIVIIVDELADLMMVAPGEVEGAICRLAQLARAAGLHLIIATQRPSVNVITGLIKANMPSRIAFSVTSGVDSRTIIDMNGAEKLLGKGDMLFYPAGYPKPVRVQGSFVSDQEVQRVVDYLIEHNGNASYSEEIEEHVNTNSTGESVMPGAENDGDDRDAYFVDAGKLIIEKEKASIGMLQRMFKIGFNRAARIMDQLSDAGVVGPEEGTKPRKVLMTMEEFEQLIES